ncbi:alanine dehydrogenase [Sulfuricurvum sp. RIFCSPLOWO2_12_FULL_43_24]|uniref:alanine dehydrogenase n=1 Tax=Sulfuricurvum sp. RIFCSPLOWO2_12_FULL_43_24 TaxID=1802247 RepID=UPI0008C8273C|nr:alanine dehydrogenase [Sulfuricurvum sp. RIFCSPLOWO2_12_FULL_43_24]OHD89130.1 MAG: alanine dehydrogenase [Sulfuricurvum sp. RIFCSPLOWO2_12_FULL_43_24]
MIIGVPKEIKTDEFRVGMTPSGVMELIKAGHSVMVERGAGLGSGFEDAQYLNTGAVLIESANDLYAAADMIVKVKEPIEVEYNRLKENQILFTYLHLAADKKLTEVLCAKKITALAYETLRVGRRLPLLEPMSEIAGRMATLFGAVHLGRYNGGSGRLLGGAVGVERNRVVVLGAGVAGKSAADAAAGLGSEVVMLDINTERLTYLRDVMAPNVTMLYSTYDTILECIKTADLIIGTVLLPGAKAPKLITNDMLSLMKKGSVLVDVSIDQGGCFETSHATTHSHPTFEIEGIVHYCVANMPGMYPRTSTVALTNATLPYAIKIASTPLEVLLHDEIYRGALNTYDGNVTNEAVAIAHSMPYKGIL